MTALLLAAWLVLPAAGQEAPAAGGIQTTSGGLSLGSADKAPSANPAGSGEGEEACRPDAPPPRTVRSPHRAEKSLGGGVFSDVAFHAGKVWPVFQREKTIMLYSASPDLSDLAVAKTIELKHHSFPRVHSACGALWLAFYDETTHEIKLWRSDRATIEAVGSSGGATFNVALGGRWIAWIAREPGRPVLRRPLLGGAAERVGTAGTSGLQQILPDGRVLTTEDVRRKETFGNVSHYAGELVVAEDYDDTGVAFRVAGGPRNLVWDGAYAHAPRGAADGAGLFAVVRWPKPRLLVFDAAGASAGAAAEDELVIWTQPSSGDSGRGVVRLAGAAKPGVRRVEILVNLKKVGNAKLDAPIWSYELDTSSYRGGIDVSALATHADGRTFRQTIRFNVR